MVDVETKLSEFQERTGVVFSRKELLQEALTHRSFVNESNDVPDNERMEFLGDAVLDYMVADMLFQKFSAINEGELTQLRSALVRTESLAQLAQDIELGDFLIVGKGEEQMGGRKRINILCRGFEALVGAIYLDKGMDGAKAFMLPRLEELLAYLLKNDLHRDARSLLQEKSQAELLITPVYRLKDPSGSEHDRMFNTDVVIGDVVIGSGSGTSKRAAAQVAARDALNKVEEASGWSQEALDYAEAHRPPPYIKPQKPRHEKKESK